MGRDSSLRTASALVHVRSSPVRGFPPSRTAWCPNLGALLRRRALLVAFTLAENVEPVVKLIEKYSIVPMGFADACLVRMTETLADPIILTTDQDFRVYRRHSRQVVPCVTPE